MGLPAMQLRECGHEAPCRLRNRRASTASPHGKHSPTQSWAPPSKADPPVLPRSRSSYPAPCGVRIGDRTREVEASWLH
ncbi:hypothetical protein G6F40_018043 [Rhizopus arrhizus]|nr:hypothetical protein G6F40_018043 [Rhizopus arrhizus]